MTEKPAHLIRREGLSERAKAVLDTLWDEDTNVTERFDSEALHELEERDPNGLAQAIGRRLSRGTSSAVTRQLVTFCNDLQVTANVCRQHLAIALFGVARRAIADGEGNNNSIVWAAIRRAATLTSNAGIANLYEFLMPGMPVKVRQVTLQAITNCTLEPWPMEPEFEPLRASVRELAESLCKPMLLGEPESIALAMNSVIAARALDLHPGLIAAWTAVFSPLVQRQINHRIKEMTDKWPPAESSKVVAVDWPKDGLVKLGFPAITAPERERLELGLDQALKALGYSTRWSS